MTHLIQQIESIASGMRAAGYAVKAVTIASLYRPAPAVLTVNWAASGIETEQPCDIPGVTASAYIKPADTCALIAAPERLYDLEARILGAAWALGA